MIYYVRRLSTGVALLSGLASLFAILIARADGSPAAWRIVAIICAVFAVSVIVRVGVAITRPLWSGED